MRNDSTLWRPRRWLILCSLFCFVATPGAAQKTIIHAGHLIDGISETPKTAVSLIVENGRIAALADGYVNGDARDTVIDLQDAYVLPGLMDMHTHLTMETERGTSMKPFQLYPADKALMALKYLRATLLAGFTTVRDVGANELIDLALRDAVKRGDVIGPRMFVAGQPLAVLGGHGDPTNSIREDILGVPDASQGVVNGVESARRAALLAIKRGADIIKVTATAGVLSLAAKGSSPQLTEAEMRVIVQTARDFGKKVAAHAHGAEGIKRAIRAGVASIEHGTYMDDEGIALMKQHGTYLVATITAGKSTADSAKIPGYYPPIIVPKILKVSPRIQATFAKAYKAGVKIAFGTDAGVYQHGRNAIEFRYMVEAGMPPMQAIKTATREAATLLGVEDRLGTLQTGKIADVIAVRGNPLEKISVMQHVNFVMKDGVVYKNEPAER